MKSQLIAILFAAGALAFAQGPRGPQPNHPVQTGSGLDMTKVQTIEGAVTAVNVAYGAQYPSIQIGSTTVKIAPVWFLLENDFEVKVGDKLSVQAAPSLQARDPYLSAIKLANGSANLTLRDANGIPLWMQPGAGQQQGPGQGPGQGTGTCTACGGLSSIATASGTVDQVSAGVGIQMPAVVLKTADKVVTVKIGPERLLDAADFEIKAGDSLTVKYAVTCTSETVGLELTNAAGVKLVLRNEDGSPAWR